MQPSTPGASRRIKPTTRLARAAGAILATIVLTLLLAACGGGASRPGASSGTANNRTSGSTNHFGGATTQQLLSFSRCMRAHGVPRFPDPDSSGDLSKGQIIALDPSSPAFVAAQRACGHFLPNSGSGPIPSELQQAWNQDRRFTHCMRTHGVPNAPEPSSDNGRPYFNLQAVGLRRTPELLAKGRRCQSLLRMSSLPNASGG